MIPTSDPPRQPRQVGYVQWPEPPEATSPLLPVYPAGFDADGAPMLTIDPAQAVGVLVADEDGVPAVSTEHEVPTVRAVRPVTGGLMDAYFYGTA